LPQDTSAFIRDRPSGITSYFRMIRRGRQTIPTIQESQRFCRRHGLGEFPLCTPAFPFLVVDPECFAALYADNRYARSLIFVSSISNDAHRHECADAWYGVFHAGREEGLKVGGDCLVVR
jgi:hypothetical protein